MSVPARGRRRQEGGEKVTGATRFTADLELAGLLHVQLVVSQAPSARIRGIETSAARSAPGVIDVITSRELPETDSEIGRASCREREENAEAVGCGAEKNAGG